MGLIEVVDQQKPELQIALSCAVAGLFINRFRAGVVGVPGDGAILCPVRDQSELSLATHDASRVLSLDHEWCGVAGVALVWVAHWQVHSQRGFGPSALRVGVKLVHTIQIYQWCTMTLKALKHVDELLKEVEALFSGHKQVSDLTSAEFSLRA